MDTLVGKTLSHYQILEKVGAGGMGEVYRAHDARLRRDVAVKVLPAELSASPERLRRFQDEARAAGGLNHPNILTIHDFGEHEGYHYEVAELLEGKTLREHIRERTLPAGKVVDYGVQIARGLSAAHAKGIVHRDLKPENLFVATDGRVKILDFGIAKLTRREGEPGAGEAVAATETEIGTVLGTSGYMAPEQVRGESVDHRADIFALGAVLYEMMSGQRAFPGDTPADAMSAVLVRDPPPLPSRLDAVPPALERIVRRCLEKNPRERFQSAWDLASALEGVEPGRPRGGRVRAPRWLVPAALGVAALAVVVAVANHGEWKNRLLIPPGARPIRSLAVLPLVNLSKDPEQEYFVEGMTEELTTRLAQIGSLRVIARTSVMQYKGGRKPVSEIGRELNVDAVVEGSVIRSGDRVRVTAQLIRTATEGHLWAQSYEQSVRDVLAIQSEVARSIAGEIAAKLTPGERDRLGRRPTVNPEAHEAYLRGRYLWNQRTVASLERSIAYFQEAIAKDPGYALAYAGLANAYGVLPHYRDIPGREIGPKARAAALKALEIDSTLGEAHAQLAGTKQEYEWDFEGAEREFRRAIELAPNSVSAHQWYGEFLGKMKRYPESIAKLERAAELDPLSPIVCAMIVDAYGDAREYDKAIQYGREAVRMFPEFKKLHRELGFVYQHQGKYEEALTEFEKSGWDPKRMGALRSAFRAAGPRGYWEKNLEQFLEWRKGSYGSYYHLASIYAQLGRKDEAFKFLERAYEDRDVFMCQLLVSALLDPLRTDPRFQALVKRVGLPG